MKLKCRVVVLGAGIVLTVVGIVLLVWPGAPRLYRMTVLPMVPGYELVPQALNDLGQVVGLKHAENVPPRLFVWDRRSGLDDLGLVAGRDCDINNRGQVAATKLDSSGIHQACVVDPNGTTRFLGSLGPTRSQATAINDRGEVAGWSYRIPGGARAFLWTLAQGMQDLGRVSGQGSRATAISEAGQVFGSFDYWQPGGRRWRPCFWDPNDPSMASGIETPSTESFAMNGNGWIVGTHTFENDGSHVVLWHAWHGIQRLFPCDRDIDVLSRSWLVNDANQVAYTEVYHSRWERYSARFFGPRFDSYLWDPRRGRIALNRYLPGGTECFEVCDVNNEGCVLGVAHLRRGQVRLPVLLKPIAERWHE